MDTNKILAELRAERGRIDHAISALENLNSTGLGAAAREPRVTEKKRGRMSAAAEEKTIAPSEATLGAGQDEAKNQGEDGLAAGTVSCLSVLCPCVVRFGVN